ncbi:protein kinase family protein [Streptomyces paludis]|uniref:protein kinase family protein n=1 Tax=Streptomyces paludis TaxID=2282738 RepID=UPI001E3F7D79|nr:protein kinase family protein [Streptomyces paludis]
MARNARVVAHRGVSSALASLSDRALGALVAGAVPLGRGIGGTSVLVEVAGVPVFVKRVPLTDWERRPEHVRSTANLFGLPVVCQYGIGGPGFGVWRELAVHTMTTDWVLAGAYEGFPLMYHWRVLPDVVPVSLPPELADVERTVAYWGGGSAVRRRIEGLRDATASVALFLEYVPQNLHQWLGERVAAGGEAAERACGMVERELGAGIAFMNGRGLLHFDAHFENILTDGRRLFFADFGLALSSRFELSAEEADFYGTHRTYDRDYVDSYLVHWLTAALYGCRGEERAALLRAWAGGELPAGIPVAAAAILARDAPLAVVVSEFLGALRGVSRATPYPLEEIRRVRDRVRDQVREGGPGGRVTRRRTG